MTRDLYKQTLKPVAARLLKVVRVCPNMMHLGLVLVAVIKSFLNAWGECFDVIASPEKEREGHWGKQKRMMQGRVNLNMPCVLAFIQAPVVHR